MHIVYNIAWYASYSVKEDLNKQWNAAEEKDLSEEETARIIKAHQEMVKGVDRPISTSSKQIWAISVPYFERPAFMAKCGTAKGNLRQQQR